MTGLFDERETELLRSALAAYTVDGVDALLGPVGQAALGRAELSGVARQLPDDGPLATLVRLFLLGAAVPERCARAALEPLPLEAATAAGVLATSAGSARALVDIRPYAQAGGQPRDWWVVSDFGTDVRRGPLPADHVLGVGTAALTLAQATPRLPVGNALDVGTGSGIQALHLGTHADAVVATDVSARALRFAATTAALSGQRWDLRHGSLLDPVAGARFDLVVANPPFVVSGGGAGHTYRDSGLPGDEVSARLIAALPGVLNDGGVGQLLANWVITAGEPWPDRVAGWLAGRGCDAWVWQRAVAEPGEYVALWLRDAGEQPGSARWRHRYGAWLDWFAAHGVLAVGMGLITLWRSDAAHPVVVLEDVPQALEQPIAAALPAWHARQRWLAATSDAALLATPLTAAPGLVRERLETLTDGGWTAASTRLRQTTGMRWELEADDAISALVAGCDGTRPVQLSVAVLAAALDAPADAVAAAVLPVLRDLVGRGFLLPGAGSVPGPGAPPSDGAP